MPDNIIEEPLIPREITLQEVSEAFVGRRPGVNSPGAMYQRLSKKWADTQQPQAVSVKPKDVITNGQTTIADAVEVLIARQSERFSVLFKNLGPDTVYIGGLGVSVGNGTPFTVNDGAVLDVSDNVYAVCDIGDLADCRWLGLGD